MSALRDQVVRLVRERGYERRDEPFRLASGHLSHDYIDGKLAIARGSDLRLAAEVISRDCAVSFGAVGGLTMGADPLAHAVAVVTGCDWFSVRKQPKERGLNRWIEGARLDESSRVLLVDDVVTTGGSIKTAFEKVRDEGAQVVAVATIVDRGNVARPWFEERGVSYYAVATYWDLGIPPVSDAG